MLMGMFHTNESGTKIAAVFGVSRQRVHQWKTQLGHERVVYVPHNDVADLVTVSPSTTRATV